MLPRVFLWALFIKEERKKSMKNILVIEDDNDINHLLQMILEREQYKVIPAFSGTEGKLLFDMQSVDLILCDLMLPGMSGEELISYIRSSSKVPVIVLTAKGGLDDKINVFELGADDYVTKPFEPKELLARVKAQLRRMDSFKDDVASNDIKATGTLHFRELVMDLEALTVTVRGEQIELTQREFQILQTMLEHPKKVFSKEALFETIWKQGYYGEDNTISVHISNIRKKIVAITSEEYISTVWGIGYKLNL